MSKTAVFPGSFDPITIGHEAIVRRALALFDEVVVAIGHNSAKQYFFDLEQRKRWIEQVFADCPTVRVDSYEGMTVNYCKSIKSNYILRGLRTAPDFEYERAIAQMNSAVAPGIETVFLLSAPEHSAINSTIVRDIIRHGGDASQFVPQSIQLHS